MKRVADGLYRHPKTQHFYWRPWVEGRRTWRKLNARTLREAREDLAALETDRRRARRDGQIDPLSDRQRIREFSVSGLLERYLSAECPDRRLQARKGKALDQDRSRIGKLLGWKPWPPIAEINQATLDRYFQFRQKTGRGKHGGRAVDLEVHTLKGAVRWGMRLELLHHDPFSDFRLAPFAKPARDVIHCRSRMPESAEELHALAQALFDGEESEVLGWQMLVGAFTGCRHGELLQFRMDGNHKSVPGYLESGILWIRRSKGGVNPFLEIHPDLEKLIESHRRWHRNRFPESPWWFPSPRDPARAVEIGGLSKALRRIAPLLIGHDVTAHGTRAFYVTVRRGRGIADGQIALEIGQRSGGREIVKTYGDVLPKSLGWMPENGAPAWSVLDPKDNILPLNRGSWKREVVVYGVVYGILQTHRKST